MTAPDRPSASDNSSPESSSSDGPAVGIDVSKASLEVVLLSGERPRSRSLPNTEEGFGELLAWLGQHARSDEAHVCLEASGGYERPVARFLCERGLTVSVVNPRRTSAYARSQLARSKTDRVDAALLARFCRREEPTPWRPPSSQQQVLKEMTRGLESLKKERERLENQIGSATNSTVIDSLEAVLGSIEEQIDQLEEEIDKHVQDCRSLAEKRALLQTIPGIGAATATLVIAELGDPDRFESARQAAAYAGLTPAHHESGSSVRRKPHLSKVGSSRLRKSLYFPALTALRCNRAIQALGDRLARRGKVRMVIVGAAMRKLLHICYGVLKNRAPFDPSLHPGT